MQKAWPTIPGSMATLVICSNTPSSICAISSAVAKRRAGTRIPGLALFGISHTASPTGRACSRNPERPAFSLPMDDRLSTGACRRNAAAWLAATGSPN